MSVKGSVQNRSYEAQDGSKRHVTEIVADEVEFADGNRNAGGNGNQTAENNAQPRRQASGGFTEVNDEELPF